MVIWLNLSMVENSHLVVPGEHDQPPPQTKWHCHIACQMKSVVFISNWLIVLCHFKLKYIRQLCSYKCILYLQSQIYDPTVTLVSSKQHYNPCDVIMNVWHHNEFMTSNVSLWCYNAIPLFCNDTDVLPLFKTLYCWWILIIIDQDKNTSVLLWHRSSWYTPQ